MANGAGECDLACQTKIIIDGGLAAQVFQETCKGLYFFFEHGGQLHNGKRVLDQLIKAEDEAFKFMRVVHEETGHHGPWPHALTIPEEPEG